MGPATYAKHLISGPRLPFTAAYFGSIGLTLFFALKVRLRPSLHLAAPQVYLRRHFARRQPHPSFVQMDLLTTRSHDSFTTRYSHFFQLLYS